MDVIVAGAPGTDGAAPGVESLPLDVARDRHWETGGTYTLVCSLDREATLAVGALGEVTLPAGGYAYTGSALGAGGYSRVDRHRRIAAGEHDVRHWHVDYLTGHPATTLRGVALAPDRDLECAVARELGGGPVAGFGASDCDCETHLAGTPSAAAVERAVRSAYERLTDG